LQNEPTACERVTGGENQFLIINFGLGVTCRKRDSRKDISNVRFHNTINLADKVIGNPKCHTLGQSGQKRVSCHTAGEWLVYAAAHLIETTTPH